MVPVPDVLGEVATRLAAAAEPNRLESELELFRESRELKEIHPRGDGRIGDWEQRQRHPARSLEVAADERLNLAGPRQRE